MQKVRLDVLLTQRGLAESQEKAQRLIMAGQVSVEGHPAPKPGHRVAPDVAVKVQDRATYVGRGGAKLEGALAAFDLDVTGHVAADVGASTGGFTDCLLQHGATKVYAIDVGYGQLAWSLRQDSRVVVMERTNARYLTSLPEQVDLVTVDASFISLTLLLPALREWLRPAGKILALIKPQFEAKRDRVSEGGVIKDAEVHREVLGRLLQWCLDHGFGIHGLVPSPLRGPAGNIEFFVYLSNCETPNLELGPLIDAGLAKVETGVW